MGEDTVKSYTGFRTISRGSINGVQRILLVRRVPLYAMLKQYQDRSCRLDVNWYTNDQQNGEVIFPFGTLDQGEATA